MPLLIIGSIATYAPMQMPKKIKAEAKTMFKMPNTLGIRGFGGTCPAGSKPSIPIHLSNDVQGIGTKSHETRHSGPNLSVICPTPILRAYREPVNLAMEWTWSVRE